MTTQILTNNTSKIRQQFPALQRTDNQGQPPLFFDGPGGSQLPDSVITAIGDYLRFGNSNMGGYNEAGLNTTAINQFARAQAGVWLGANPENIVFGLNSTSLMFNISRAVSQTWQAGDNIVLSPLEHFSHVSSWQRAAEDKGVTVKMLPLNANLDDIDITALDELIDERTRLVAVSFASNVIGTVTDLSPIITKAKTVGALVSIDAVHGVVHLPINVVQLGADIVFTSAYKIGGPHLGIMSASTEILHQIKPYKVEPATDIAPMAWEQGTQSFEAQAGFVAMMAYWASLGDTQLAKTALTAENKQQAYQNVIAYEKMLSEHILAKFAERPQLRLYGKKTAEGRTPTFAFNIVKDGEVVDGMALSRYLGEQNVALGCGNFYAKKLVETLNPTQKTILRMGCLHYTTIDEIDKLFALIDKWTA